MQKALLFSAADLELRNGPRLLTKAHVDGYTIVPLDSPAVSLASELELPYQLLEDILGRTAFHDALEKAAFCERNWYHSSREAFTEDGVCWPEIDSLSMRWFWQDAMVALELAQFLRRHQAEELSLFDPLILRSPQVSLGSSDTWGALLAAELPGKVKKIKRLSSLRFAWWYGGLLRLIGRKLNNRMFRRSSAVPEGMPDVTKKFLLVVSSQEFHRYGQMIRDLATNMPEHVAVVVIGGRSKSVVEFGKECGIRVHAGPLSLPGTLVPDLFPLVPTRAMSELGRRFMAAYRIAVRKAGGKPWEQPLSALEFHFTYYCGFRWPMLHRNHFSFWTNLFSQGKPVLLLIPSQGQGEYRLVIEAARRHGIGTCLIPHAGVPRVDTDGHSDYWVFQHRAQKSFMKKLQVPENRLIGIRGIFSENEYAVSPATGLMTNDRLRILALLDDTTACTNSVVKDMSLSDQLAALRILGECPADIASKIDLALKVHPGWGDVDIIAAVSYGLADKILPVSSDLISILRNTDLVIAVNYYGSALISVLRSGVPIIFLCTATKWIDSQAAASVDTFLAGGVFVGNAREFWDVVRNFLSDPEIACELSEKSRRFGEEWLSEQDFPSVVDWLQQIQRGTIPSSDRCDRP